MTTASISRSGSTSAPKKPAKVATALLVAAELTLLAAGFALGKSAVVFVSSSTGTAHAAQCCEAKAGK